LFVMKKRSFLFTFAFGSALLLVSFPIPTLRANPRAVSQASHAGTQNKPTSAAAAEPHADTTHWTLLKNKYGWKIKYPKSWQPDNNPVTSGLVTFFGPGDCTKERCASFQVDSEIFQSINGDDKKSPEQFLGGDRPSTNLFNRRAFEMDGFPAFEVSAPNNPVPTRGIAVKHDGKILLITYSEGGKDNDAIKSPRDWKYVTEFDKILTTLSFYKVPESVWPKQ